MSYILTIEFPDELHAQMFSDWMSNEGEQTLYDMADYVDTVEEKKACRGHWAYPADNLIKVSKDPDWED